MVSASCSANSIKLARSEKNLSLSTVNFLLFLHLYILYEYAYATSMSSKLEPFFRDNNRRKWWKTQRDMKLYKPPKWYRKKINTRVPVIQKKYSPTFIHNFQLYHSFARCDEWIIRAIRSCSATGSYGFSHIFCADMFVEKVSHIILGTYVTKNY